MATQQSRYPGYGIIYPHKSTTGLKVVRIFSEGAKKIRHADGSIDYLAPNPTIMELVGGAFCYASGQIVNNKEHLVALPPGMRDKALEWFDVQRTIPESAIVKEPEPVKRQEPDGPWIISSDIPEILDYAEGQTKGPKSKAEIEDRSTEVRDTNECNQNILSDILRAVNGLVGTVKDQGDRIALIEKGTPKQSDRLIMARKNQSEKMKQKWAERRAAKEALGKATDAGSEVVTDVGHTPKTNEDLQAV